MSGILPVLSLDPKIYVVILVDAFRLFLESSIIVLLIPSLFFVKFFFGFRHIVIKPMFAFAFEVSILLFSLRYGF